MAKLRIRGAELQFELAEFDRLARMAGAVFGNRMFKSELEPLRDLLARGTAPVHPDAVISAIDQIAFDKRRKYKAVIDYVIFHWPHMIPSGMVTQVADPRTGTSFVARLDPARVGDDLDLVYGLSLQRSQALYDNPYTRFCDAFNKAADYGTGSAFNRALNGQGKLGASKSAATAAINATTRVAGLKGGITQATRQAHVTGLMASRFNPVSAMGMKGAQLQSDMQLSSRQIQLRNGLSDRDLRISRHRVAHARVIKGIRRACKGGIAMVASSAGYLAVGAKVHFVLDGMGDLGAVAMKLPRSDSDSTYVAITSSELAFCHRYWTDPFHSLANIVRFYVNGEEVEAPWEGDWQLNDSKGKPVISNQEAWLRYALARCKRSVEKPFPAY